MGCSRLIWKPVLLTPTTLLLASAAATACTMLSGMSSGDTSPNCRGRQCVRRQQQQQQQQGEDRSGQLQPQQWQHEA
jgi:hypothetical protein